jgi:hypothetical protein
MHCTPVFDCTVERQILAGLAESTCLAVVSNFESLAKLWICGKNYGVMNMLYASALEQLEIKEQLALSVSFIPVPYTISRWYKV